MPTHSINPRRKRGRRGQKRKFNLVRNARVSEIEERLEEDVAFVDGDESGSDDNTSVFPSSLGDDDGHISEDGTTLPSVQPNGNNPNDPNDPNSDDSSSDSSYFPDDYRLDDDPDGVDDFLGLLVTAASREQEPVAVIDQGSDDSSPNATNQDQPPKPKYEDSDEPPPIQDARVEWSSVELASLELLSLCDQSGARRGFYDELLALLRSFSKQKLDIKKAKNRDTLLKRISEKVSTPEAKVRMVGDRPVVYFPFIDSLRDLLSSTTFDDIGNLCANEQEEDRFKPFWPVGRKDYGEIMANDWARDTLESIEDFDEERDLFVAAMMYGDQTGTDVNQRYPLEPWMFTICLLRRSARENSDSWRHMGFQPSLDFLNKLSVQEKLQCYHDHMEVLLEDFKEACREPPVMWVNLGGTWKKKRLIIKLSVILGDQKSQDYICGRRPINNGNAGGIHRGCGSSAIHFGCALDHNSLLTGRCRPPPTKLIKRLNTIALLDVNSLASGVVNELVPPDGGRETKKQHKRTVELLERVKKLAQAILNKVFSMYEHSNAFDGIDFGANSHGVFVATAEDHLHSYEAGALHEASEVSYHGLKPTERTELEGIIRKKVLNCKSSALNELPRGTVKKDFGKLTLTSHNEKVGSVFYLLLALHDQRGRELFQAAHSRQAEKYMSFSISKNQKDDKDDKQQESSSSLSDRPPELESSTRKQKSSTRQELPPTAFPFKSDLLFGSDYHENQPFDHTEESIEFVCEHLHLHGLGFLLEDDSLDVYQLDLLMMSAWKILQVMEVTKEYPSNSTLKDLSLATELHDIILPPVDDDDCQSNDGTPSPVESACIDLLPRQMPQRTVDAKANHAEPLTIQTKKPSLPIRDCVAKHRRFKPKVNGDGYTGAVLCDMPTYVAMIEMMLCYHAWCHYSSDLPKEDQEDHELGHFARGMLVQYFDATMYKGDHTVDSDSGKLHSQLHHMAAMFGDPMGHNTHMGERGLKEWAKRSSSTALKQGRDKFTASTCDRVGEKLKINRALDLSRRWQAQHSNHPTAALQPHRYRRKVAHFLFERNLPSASPNRLLAMNRDGKAMVPNRETGRIDPRILEAIHQLEQEVGNQQPFFELWCEAQLQPSERTVRCWPQYRSGLGQKNDWVLVRFETEGGGSKDYPAKVLALYEDSNSSTLKALIHSVEWKMETAREGPFGDSHLITHYRLQFDNRGEPNLMTVPFNSIVRCVVGYQTCIYRSPLVPRVRSAERQKAHTVMIVRPRDQWAKLFVDWMRELKERQTTIIGRNRNRLDFELSRHTIVNRNSE